MSQLAEWKCHKVVKAGKILPVQILDDEGEGTSLVMVEDCNGAQCSISIPTSAFARGVPKPGDYIVIYDDKYKSWSPAKAFEDGYSRI